MGRRRAHPRLARDDQQVNIMPRVESCETFNVKLFRFRELGKRVFYVTNNSTKHRREYKTKLDKLGFGGSLVGDSLNWA